MLYSSIHFVITIQPFRKGYLEMKSPVYVKQFWDKNLADNKYQDQWISDDIWFRGVKDFYCILFIVEAYFLVQASS